MEKDLKTIIKKLDQLIALLGVQSVVLEEVKKQKTQKEDRRPVFNPLNGGKKVK